MTQHHFPLPTFIIRTLICVGIFGVAVATLGLIGASRASSAAPLAWQTKVDPWVLQTAAEGETEFVVMLKEQADLSRADELAGKIDKGTYVYHQLTETANRTQGALLASLKEMADRDGATVEYQPFWVANAVWVRGGSEVIQAVAQRPDVAHLYANPKVKLDLPEQPEQPLTPAAIEAVEWNVQQVRAPQVWAAGYTGQNVVIGGQDTGYDWDHVALKNQYRGWNGVSADHNYSWHDAIHSGGGSCGANSPIPCDDGTHGTHTMGTMVGDDGGSNQVGVAPGARWIGCRNMNVGVGTPATYMECYQWFIAPTDLNNLNPRPDLAPDVINNSWSCPVDEGCNDPNVLKTAVENVRAAGIVTAHSAGNSGASCSSVSTPAAIYEASFSVGSTDANDIIAYSSSRGPVIVDGSGRMKPDISAPGVNVRSTIPGDGYSIKSGTSMAAPHIAGVVALLISARPELAGQVDLIENLIKQSAFPRTTSQLCGGVPGSQIPNNTYGWGRVDAWNALQMLEPALEISKTASDITYDPGQIITYTLQISYTDPLSPTHHLVITDVIPTGVNFITATIPHTQTGTTINWGWPQLDPNESHTVEMVVQVPLDAVDPIINQDYSVSSDEIATVFGIPVSIYLAKYLFLSIITR